MDTEKICSIERLCRKLEAIRPGKSIVHCHGVFDILHLGHIRHLRAAKAMGDVLVVTISPDRYVNKGPHRPVFSEPYRAEVLAALSEVDFVAVNEWPTAVETIKLLRPDFYVKGAEYSDAAKDISGKIVEEEAAVRSVGGQLRFTNGITFSSSNLANRCFPALSEQGCDFVSEFARRNRPEAVVRALDSLDTLKVLVVGETIIDEYHFCETIGKSGKEPILASRYQRSERYAGGILAVANHVASFSGQVDLVSQLGEVDSHQEFIAEQLNGRVKPHFLTLPKAPTIVKRRFVEHYPFQKLFEIYVMNGCEYDRASDEALCRELEERVPEADLVVVADYGHGMINSAARRIISEKSRFLALNTQQNAGNQGFHAFSKYPRADFISISENELRMEARSRTRDLKELIREASKKVSCDKILITQGEKGCLCFDAREGFVRVPAFSANVVDRTGAGDTVLAITAMAAAKGFPMETIGFLGAVAGAQAVGTMCNKAFLDKVAFSKHLVSLLM
ncbi:MAG: PfkB family carbohydrate kinase [Desulfovibrionaceae bacterium]|nr:PfkB family carbohydrate kinase [Desulfovibrionaceae bacterium]